MPKIQPSKDTVYYRHGAWGTMRLNTFDYLLIRTKCFSNQKFIAAKLLPSSHAYGMELPNMARIQIVPMYSIEQEEDGAFVKKYIQKSDNVHCLVMDKNAVDELLNITLKVIKKHSVVAYVPRVVAAVSVHDKDDRYEVINIFPTSRVVAIKQEKEIFVLLNGRRLEQNVGKPSTLDISKTAETTVINLNKEIHPTAVRLYQLQETEFLSRGKSGLRIRKNPAISNASGTDAGPSMVQAASNNSVVKKEPSSLLPPPQTPQDVEQHRETSKKPNLVPTDRQKKSRNLKINLARLDVAIHKTPPLPKRYLRSSKLKSQMKSIKTPTPAVKTEVIYMSDNVDEDVATSVVDKRIVDPPVAVVVKNIVANLGKSSSKKPITVIRKVNSSEGKKNTEHESDSDEWIDIADFKNNYAAQRKTIRYIQPKHKLEKES